MPNWIKLVHHSLFHGEKTSEVGNWKEYTPKAINYLFRAFLNNIPYKQCLSVVKAWMENENIACLTLDYRWTKHSELIRVMVSRASSTRCIMGYCYKVSLFLGRMRIHKVCNKSSNEVRYNSPFGNPTAGSISGLYQLAKSDWKSRWSTHSDHYNSKISPIVLLLIQKGNFHRLQNGLCDGDDVRDRAMLTNISNTWSLDHPKCQRLSSELWERKVDTSWIGTKRITLWIWTRDDDYGDQSGKSSGKLKLKDSFWSELG